MIAHIVAALVLQAGSPAETEAACGAWPGVAGLLAEADGRALLLGERHGTWEAPGVAGQLVCLSLAAATPTTLVMEIPSAEQARLDAYLLSDGGDDARQALLGDSRFWDGPLQDGRSSQAWLQLIDAVRIWSQSGQPVTLLAADRGPGDMEVPGPQPRDRVMAQRVQAQSQAGRQVIMLTGNVHARRIQARFGERVLETVGTYLPDGSFVSVNLLGDGGESWVCTGTSMEDMHCGPQPAPELDIGGEPRLITAQEADACACRQTYASAFHAVVFLGPVSPARPALELIAGD